MDVSGDLIATHEQAVSVLHVENTANNLTTSLPKVIREEGRVVVLPHTYAVKSPLLTMVCCKFAPKVPLPVNQSSNPTKCLIPGPVRRMMPFRIRSAISSQCTGQTDRPTHVRTDRSSTGKFHDYRLLCYESDAA